MSRTVSIKGKLELVTDGDLNIYIKRNINDFFSDNVVSNLEEYDYYKDFKDMVSDMCSESYLIQGDTLYKFIEKSEYDDGEDVLIVNYHGGGEFSFYCSYYNGGTCLSEVLEGKLIKDRANNDLTDDALNAILSIKDEKVREYLKTLVNER